MPDGTSAKLIKVDEKNAAEEKEETEKFTGWDYENQNAKISTFKIENNPYFTIKRYRILKDTIRFGPIIEIDDVEPETKGTNSVNIYDDVKWAIKAPDNTIYFFDHPQYSIKTVPQQGYQCGTSFDPECGGSAVVQTNPFTPEIRRTHYYRNYHRWDITEVWPNGLENNAVKFAYKDFYSYLSKGRDYYKEMIDACINVYNNKGQDGKAICYDITNVPFSDRDFSWELVGSTKYISTSYPDKIYQELFDGTAKKEEEAVIFKSSYRDQEKDVIYRTHFSDTNDNAKWSIYPQEYENPSHAGYPFKSLGNALNYIVLKGTESIPFGVYREIDVEPFTTYVVEAEIEIPVDDMSNLRSQDQCTVEDLSTTQDQNNFLSGVRRGYYGMVKIDTRSFDDGQYPFRPSNVFTYDQAHGGLWKAYTYWNTDKLECWPSRTTTAGALSCNQLFAGPIYELDSYLINCWNLNREKATHNGRITGNGIIIETYNTFTTANERKRKLILSSYNKDLPHNPLVHKLTIRKVPESYYLKKITHKRNQYPIAMYDLTYQDLGLRYSNLKKIEQKNIFDYINEKINFGLFPQTLPPTIFEYKNITSRLLNKIKLPTGGIIEFDTIVKPYTYLRPNYWAIKFGNWNDATSIINKYSVYVNNVKVTDDYGTYTTSYTYPNTYPSDSYWDDEKETFFSTDATVKNPYNDESYHKFYTPFESFEGYLEKDLQKLIGATKKTISYKESNIKLSETNNKLSVYRDAQKFGNDNVFTIRTDEQTKTSYDEFGKNPMTVKTTNQQFDLDNCDLPEMTITEGFLEDSDNYDTIITFTDYAGYSDGMNKVICLLEKSLIADKDGTTASKSTTEYYKRMPDDEPHLGLVKKTTAHNLQKPDKSIITEFEYDEYRNKILIKDTYGRKSKIIYDPTYNKYPVKAINPKEHKINVDYNEAQQIIKVTDENNYPQYFLYDEFGRLCKYQSGGVPTLTRFDGTKLCKQIERRGTSSAKGDYD